MGLSRELYDLVLLIFKPTEGTSKFLDLILNVFTARVKTFEPRHTAPIFLMQLTINYI